MTEQEFEDLKEGDVLHSERYASYGDRTVDRIEDDIVHTTIGSTYTKPYLLEHYEVIKPAPDTYTLQQCVEQRISIHVTDYEDKIKLEALIKKELNQRYSIMYDHTYIRVYPRLTERDPGRPIGSSSSSYLSEYWENVRSTKEIPFSQIVPSGTTIEDEFEGVDRKTNFRVIGNKVILSALINELKDLNYNVEVRAAEDGLCVDFGSQDNNNHRLIHTHSRYVTEEAKGILFELPKDYSRVIEFATKVNDATKHTLLFAGNTELTVVGNNVTIKHASLGANETTLTKQELLKRFQDIFEAPVTRLASSTFNVDEVRIGCTTYTRNDYRQLLSLLS